MNNLVNNLALRENPTLEWIESLRTKYPTERYVDGALTRKLMRRKNGPAEVTDKAQLLSKLREFLSTRVEGDFKISNLQPLTGGASKEQYVFEMDWIHKGEQRIRERMVLRREPAESVVESDRLREFQLLSGVSDIVPVPTAYWLDESGDELGSPSLIYAFVSGVQKPPVGTSNVTGIGIEFNESYRDALGPQVIEYLANIHRFQGEGKDFSAFDFPEVGTTQDIDWQLNWWSRCWQEDMYEAIPLMTLAEQWLRANRRPLDHLSLVHSDYRTGNYLFDPDTRKITAILDWELGYFGDRHFDLAWLLMSVFATPDENGKFLYSSIFRREAFIDAYCEASGFTIEEDRLRYYTVFALWKGAIFTLGAALRAAGGLRSHQDVVLCWFAGLGYPFCEYLRKELSEVTHLGKAG
jgi:aminoglycoside phosphotransferase (APT) family kinase protein